jgi:flagellar hook assembly protein FlgD
VRFELPAAGHARLAIFDVAGRLVRTLVDADLAAGAAEAQWDGRDAGGTAVGSGTYLARLESGGDAAVSRLVLVR